MDNMTMIKSDVTGEWITCAEYVKERDNLAERADNATKSANEANKDDPAFNWIKDL